MMLTSSWRRWCRRMVRTTCAPRLATSAQGPSPLASLGVAWDSLLHSTRGAGAGGPWASAMPRHSSLTRTVNTYPRTIVFYFPRVQLGRGAGSLYRVATFPTAQFIAVLATALAMQACSTTSTFSPGPNMGSILCSSGSDFGQHFLRLTICVEWLRGSDFTCCCFQIRFYRTSQRASPWSMCTL